MVSKKVEMIIKFNVSEAANLYYAMDTILLSRNLFELPDGVYSVCQGLLNCSKDFLSRIDLYESYNN